MLDWSPSQLFMLLVHYPLQIVALLMLAALAGRLRVPERWAWCVSFASLAALVGFILVTPLVDTDFKVFWHAGQDTLAGTSPYDRPGCLNPPQAFAVYTLLATMPFDTAWQFWVWFNAVGTACLAVLTYAVLRSSPDSDNLSAPILGVLTAVMALSVTCRYGIDVGQVSTFITLMVLVVMYAWIRHRPVLGGVGLALASIKPPTMLPLLLFYGKPRHWLTWTTLGVAGLGLYFLANPPFELFSRLGECLRNIDLAHQPGKRDDYPIVLGDSLITLTRAIYFSGITDRSLVTLIQFSVLGVLGLYLAWRILGPKPLSAPAACSLVAIFATIFLYHRVYDLLLLVVPLVYALGRARAEASWARWLYTATVLVIAGALFMRIGPVKALNAEAMGEVPPPQWLQALVIPHAMWLILLGFGFLAAAERWRRQEKPAAGDATVSFQRVEMCWPDRLQRVAPAMLDLADRAVEKKL